MVRSPTANPATTSRALRIAIGFLTLAALGATLFAFRRVLMNPVNYEAEYVRAPWLITSLLIPALTVVAVTFLAANFARRPKEGVSVEVADRRHTAYETWLRLICAVGAFLVGAAWLYGEPPTFLTFCLVVTALAWCVRGLDGVFPVLPLPERIAAWSLAGLIVLATVWHALEQAHFWEHFLLGYADFGFFTTELEHCLPWKDVGPERFADTRLGYHAVWMFYLLVPFYALLRSPLFLMFVGPLALNLAAVAFYTLGRDRSGSRLVGLIVAVGWLCLPSVTRLPYSNTYGFQSIYLAVPWLAFALSLGLRGRWFLSHVCLAAAVLCEETVCGVAFGWGLTLVLFTPRRRDGLIIMAVSVAYLALMAGWVIPAFAREAEYSRLQLFGDLPVSGLFERLTRARVLYYLLALMVPLLPGLVGGRRLIVAAIPTLLLVLLLQQRDYLNIKYWHQSSVLPVLYAAAVIGVTNRQYRGASSGSSRESGGPLEIMPDLEGDAGARNAREGLSGTGEGSIPGLTSISRRVDLAPPVALLVSIGLFHFVMGISPASQAQRIYEADSRLNSRDPRLDAVEWVRETFPDDQYGVIATERMAAHFTDYRMVWPAPRARLGAMPIPYVVVLDRSDRWDKIVMEGETELFLHEAEVAGFHPVKVVGSVVVLAPSHP
ncbi:MAG: DUF2079 domain-containing protein [Phycisphaerae bacterium]|nr:DUF2079 domain-containing protein [Phycisphaerae bacterium]